MSTEVLVSMVAGVNLGIIDGAMALLEVLHHIKTGKWQDMVLDYRNGKSEKKSLPGYTPSALFEGRRDKSSFVAHSGIIAIDLDHEDNPDIGNQAKRLESDPFTLCLHRSVGGYGYVWYVKIPPRPENHALYYEALEKYLANEYQLIADPSCKDVTRLRFISYDPDLHLNGQSKKWTKLLPKKKRSPVPVVRAFHDDDLQYILEQIQQKGINIAEDYHDWIRIGFALVDEYSEAGREYFHGISAQSAKYTREATDKFYDQALKRTDRSGEKVTMGTLIHLCRQAGIETQTRNTRLIESAYKQRRIANNNASHNAIDETVKQVQKLEEIPEERIRDTLEAVKNVPSDELGKGSQLEELEWFLQSLPIRYNRVTRELEREGKVMDDKKYNEVWRRALHTVNDRLTFDRMMRLMHSDIYTSYNPFTDFIQSNGDVKSDGMLGDLMDCIEFEPYEEEDAIPVLKGFIKKWVISIVASMRGTYSLLTLVLCGPQGCGKSNFFRYLLPDELQEYYAESKLEMEKDSGMLMGTKLLIVDDEFSGKNKRDAAQFKELSSKDYFTIRRPYFRKHEKIKRYAVLGGTSNDNRVVYDFTGNRRIIPVNVRRIDFDRFKGIDKIALLMECNRLIETEGETVWQLNTQDIQNLERITDVNQAESIEFDVVNKHLAPCDGDSCNKWTTTEAKCNTPRN